MAVKKPKQGRKGRKITFTDGRLEQAKERRRKIVRVERREERREGKKGEPGTDMAEEKK